MSLLGYLLVFIANCIICFEEGFFNLVASDVIIRNFSIGGCRTSQKCMYFCIGRDFCIVELFLKSAKFRICSAELHKSVKIHTPTGEPKAALLFGIFSPGNL
jgi:hypothetical protein